MTTTYDPHHPNYLDEADVRGETARVQDVCASCRACVSLCVSFPTLFEMLERHDDGDAGRLTPAQQDQVVDACSHCAQCVVNCPYTPDRHELAVDVPRLMLRFEAMRAKTGQISPRRRTTTRILARTHLLGRLGGRTATTTNRIVRARPAGIVRRALAAGTGISSKRALPLFAAQPFTAWFDRRPRVRIGRRQGAVTLFPTCIVEHQAPQIGHDVVKVYERNGVEVGLAGGRCCGAPWLHGGEQERFTAAARENVGIFAAAVRAGNEVVVLQPTCTYVIRHHYPQYVPGPVAALVAEHTFDASEYLMRLHRTPGTTLDMDFTGGAPTNVTYHAPPHLRAMNIGLRSRDLMKLTGAKVTLVQRASGNEAMWGLRAENDQIGLTMAAALGDAVVASGGDVVAGDCHLANIAIAEQTGIVPVHPIQVVARAYGIAVEEPRR